MMLFIAVELVLMVIAIAMVMRVWRASALDGVLCLIVPFYAFVPMVKHWKDPQHDIRWHVGLLLAGGLLAAWLQVHALRELAAERQQVQSEANRQAQTLHDYVYAGTQEDEGPAPDDGEPVDLGRAGLGHASPAPNDPWAKRPDAPAAASRGGAAAPSAPSGDSADMPRAPSAVRTTFTLAQAVRAATYQRGSFDRTTMGFTMDIPEHFHLLAGNDMRRIESAAQLPPDRREVAWLVHETVTLDAPGAWHVAMRWHSDGWVAANVAFDAWRLLLDARQRGGTKLAGSGGALIGYAIAPRYASGVADWVEERLPAGATASVLDCHAVRLGHAGVIEFSVVAAPPGSQALCDASVRLLARSVHFEPGADWRPSAAGGARAPYNLAELVAGAR